MSNTILNEFDACCLNCLWYLPQDETCGNCHFFLPKEAPMIDKGDFCPNGQFSVKHRIEGYMVVDLPTVALFRKQGNLIRDEDSTEPYYKYQTVKDLPGWCEK